ncbi:MAG: FGGY-family carbohydrate kinase [Pseudomonadota bacterium]
MDELFIGIDVGTSGCRAVAITWYDWRGQTDDWRGQTGDRHGQIGDGRDQTGDGHAQTDSAGRLVAQASVAMPVPRRNDREIDQDPMIWWSAVESALERLLVQLDPAAVRAIAVDGTSGTLLLTDGDGMPLSPGLMYNDSRAVEAAARISAVAPPTSGALGATSALAKLLHLTERGHADKAIHALHQADWIAARLSGRFGVSDDNNALKLGYDVVERRWPPFLGRLGLQPELLPEVLEPGTVIGPVTEQMAKQFGLPADVLIVAGTTDGVAAFLATGASEAGDAVTSLGSTLVVKQLADRPLFDPSAGVYSHRLGDLWLPGGASNSGGAALARFFDVETIERLTPELRPDQSTGLDYYPLPDKGERFPINDPAKPSITEPRPKDEVTFLQALLEGIAAIEALAYEKLRNLGAPPLGRLRTVGGGAANPAWTAIRKNRLGVPMQDADNSEAAFGAARLARKGYLNA